MRARAVRGFLPRRLHVAAPWSAALASNERGPPLGRGDPAPHRVGPVWSGGKASRPPRRRPVFKGLRPEEQKTNRCLVLQASKLKRDIYILKCLYKWQESFLSLPSGISSICLQRESGSGGRADGGGERLSESPRPEIKT